MWQHMERASGGNMADPIWSGRGRTARGQPGAKRNGLQMYSRWREEGDKKSGMSREMAIRKSAPPPQLVNHSMWAASNRFPPSSSPATQIEDNGRRGRKEPGKDGMPESQLLKEPSNDGRFRFMELAIQAGSRVSVPPHRSRNPCIVSGLID